MSNIINIFVKSVKIKFLSLIQIFKFNKKEMLSYNFHGKASIFTYISKDIDTFGNDHIKTNEICMLNSTREL